MFDSISWKRIRLGLEQSRRDATMLARGLTGRHPSPLLRRAPRGAAARARGRSTALRGSRLVEVVEVVRETDHAVSLWLRLVNGDAWSFTAGQFLTVMADVDGGTHRRAYSISSSAAESRQVRITCKQVPGGRVSSYLNHRVKVGDRLRVFGPSGSFTAPRRPGDGQHHVLIGGGSGITPLMGIAQAVLASEPRSLVSLLYGNRSEEEVIFRRELDELQATYPRLTVRHVLEQLGATLSDATEGVLEAATVAAELDRLLAGRSLPARFYSCGPAPMMAAARRALAERGVDGSQVLEERFASPKDRVAPAAAAEPQPLTVIWAEGSRQVQVAPGQTVLEAALAAEVPVRFSCTMGGCGACKTQLRKGEVLLTEPNCLSPDEQASGEILPCVAYPRGPLTVEVAE